MKINLTNVAVAETQQPTTSTFKSVKPGLHTLTILKLEASQAGTKDTLKVTFSSKEAEAEFTHTFFLTEKALPSLQYLITKFTGTPLEGDFEVAALAAVLVGKSQTCIVDGQITPRNKDGKWFNNTYPRLRFAGYVLEDPSTYVDKEGDVLGYRMDRSQEMNLAAVNGSEQPSSSNLPTATTEDDDLPF